MRAPRWSVAFRILAGATAIAGLAAATGAISLFSLLQQEYERVATATVPELAAAAALMRQGNAVAAAAPALAAAPDPAAREAERARMGDRVARLEELVVHLIATGQSAAGTADNGSAGNGSAGNGSAGNGSAGGEQPGSAGAGLEALEHHKNELVGTLQTLNAQVRQQRALTIETEARVRSLEAAVDALNARLGEGEARAAPDGDAPDGAESGGQERAALERWRRELAGAAAALPAALRTERDGPPDRLQAAARASLDSAARALALLPAERAAQLKPIQDEVEAAAFGRSPLVTLHAAELSLRRAIGRSAARIRTVSDRMAGIASDHLLAVERDAARRSAEFGQAVRRGERAVTALVLVSILGAAATVACWRRIATARPPVPAVQAGERAGIAAPPVPPEPGALPVLDLDHVAETFGDLGQGTLEMMDFFVETTRPTLDRALAALAAGDVEEARAAAHTAAGAARTAGAPALAAACTALERALLDRRVDDAVRHAGAMAVAFPAVEKAIHALHHTKETVTRPKECMAEPDHPT